MKKPSLKPIRFSSSKSEDQPATRKMLRLVRDELKNDLKRIESKFDGRFDQIGAEFNQIDSKFVQIDSKFSQIDAKFEQFEAKFVQMEAKFEANFVQMDAKFESRFDRMELLLEEQNANNRIVLEGLQALWQRQDRIEEKLSDSATARTK